ncbi:MAG: Uma2 family endonuclease [Candidatus Coatesbacteria bacterium]
MLKLKPRKTVDDYMKLPEGTLAELIEGELFMTPSPKSVHQEIVEELYSALRQFVRAGSLGRVRLAPLDVHLPSGDIVQPDILFIRTANLGIVQDWIRGVPDVLIEVVSPEHPERDRLVKRGLYARNGVSEFWIVDPATRTVEVLVLDGPAYASHGYFDSADALTSPAFAGLSLPLAEIFPPQP